MSRDPLRVSLLGAQSRGWFEGKSMKNYYRIMLGRKSLYAKECHDGSFIGADFLADIDLTKHLPENWREFNQKFIPVYLEKNPGKSKVSAGLACGALHTICKGLLVGDVVLCPNGAGGYFVGEVSGEYAYEKNQILPHRRKVHWHREIIQRSEMSQALQYSTGSIGTVSNITQYAVEIEGLIGGRTPPKIVATDDTIEDPHIFALEKHLEEFLVANWQQTELGKEYDIYEEEDERVGQQYETDTGPIDILALSKDKKTLLVIELKRGRASDVVVGQVLRYMGYVQEELSEENQEVRGLIIALDDDQKIKRALSAVPNIDFYRYQISFKLVRG